jgi:hypothetical protein
MFQTNKNVYFYFGCRQTSGIWVYLLYKRRNLLVITQKINNKFYSYRSFGYSFCTFLLHQNYVLFGCLN